MRWHYCNSKWEARIFNGTRQVSLGYFDNESEAATAYDAQARKMRGNAAILNFPSDDSNADKENAAEHPAESLPADAQPTMQAQGKASLESDHSCTSYWLKSGVYICCCGSQASAY